MLDEVDSGAELDCDSFELEDDSCEVKDDSVLDPLLDVPAGAGAAAAGSDVELTHPLDASAPQMLRPQIAMSADFTADVPLTHSDAVPRASSAIDATRMPQA